MCINKTLYIDQLQTAFNHFNDELFGGQLPEVVITANAKKGSLGHFAWNRWTTVDSTVHEINLNPNHLLGDERDILSTLVHEQVHLWQQVYGKPSRGGYHNKQWVGMMLDIGLKPMSATTGDKGTGQSVDHDVVDGELFDLSYWRLTELPDWQGLSMARLDNYGLLPDGKVPTDKDGKPLLEGGDKPKPKKPAKKSKFKYSCTGCNANVWGKADLKIGCLACESVMEMCL